MSAGFLGAFLRRAETEPDRVLITLREAEQTTDLTHAALVSDASRWAAHLRSAGGEPGDVILILLPLGADLVHAFLGALFAGCVPSLMPTVSTKQDPALFWSSHNALFARLGGGVIVTSQDNRAAVATNITDAAMIVVTPQDAAAATPDPFQSVHAWKPGDIACLQHSSGTTGLKKGVMMSFETIDAQLAAYRGTLGLDRDDTIVSWLPLYHDMGFVACFLLPLATGARTVLLDPFAWLVDPLALFDLAARYQAGFVWLPNFAFNHLVNAAYDDERRVDLGAVRAIIDCSEPCKPDSLARFDERFRAWGLKPNRLLTCYAMAETVFAVSQSPMGHAPRVIHVDRARLENGTVAATTADAPEGVDLISSGRPLPGVEIAILDEALLPALPDVVGQIAVRAPFLFAGYHLEPERSATAFHDGFYLTNDLGFRIDDELFVLGRRDDLLIILGRNVFANEVEAILAGVPGLKPGRVLAMGLPNAAVGSQDLVVLAETEGDDLDFGALRTSIRSRLDSILGIVPKKIAFVPGGWLVKSTSGKISRNANRLKYLAQPGAGGKPVAPRGALIERG